jgi:transmembrane sensor
MGNILKFSRRRVDREEEIFDQSSAWIAKMSRGLTREETEQLQAWLGDHRCREVLFKMAEIWDKMDNLQSLADIFPVPEPETDTRKTARAEASQSPGRSQKLEKSSSKRTTFTAFALSAMATALMAAVILSTFPGVETSENTFNKTFITAKGETTSFDLNDGSHLVLNTDGRLLVRYSNRERLLILEQGELSIDVAHDSSRPLSVIIGNRIVQAVGTAFNVHMRDKHLVEIIVTEGTVRVKEVTIADRDRPIGRLPETATTVTRGEKITLDGVKEAVTEMEEADIAADLGWRQGNLIFRGETLEQALMEVTRYTDVEFEFEGSDIRNKKIAGLFKIGDIPGLLSALDKNFQIGSERVNDKKIILRDF